TEANFVAVPQPVQQGEVRFITGGIGEEERSAIEAGKHDYNLHITAANAKGQYYGNERVKILDRSGTPVIDSSAGPLFYAKLPPGTYTVEVSLDGKMDRRQVTVG